MKTDKDLFPLHLYSSSLPLFLLSVSFPSTFRIANEETQISKKHWTSSDEESLNFFQNIYHCLQNQKKCSLLVLQGEPIPF